MQVVKGTIRDTRQKVTNLVENNEYQYRVCAINKAGAGNYSEASDLYKAYDPIGIQKIQALFLSFKYLHFKIWNSFVVWCLLC